MRERLICGYELGLTGRKEGRKEKESETEGDDRNREKDGEIDSGKEAIEKRRDHAGI